MTIGSTSLRARLAGPIAALLLVACSGPAATGGPSVATPAARTPSIPPSATASDAPTATPTEPVALPEWAALVATGPPPREDHTWTLDDAGEIAWLFGGRDRGTVHGDLWMYDLAGDAWEQVSVPAGPPPRFGHEAVWVDDVGLVVFGGQAGPNFFNDLWAYDPRVAEWRELPATGDVPVARYGTCGAIGPDGRLWISHGFTSENARFDDTLAYDFGSGVWTDETPPEPLPVERCLHGCWWTDDGQFTLYAGQTTGTLALGDLWRLGDGAWTRVDASLPPDRNLYARARFGPNATVVFGGQALDRSYLRDLSIFADDGELTTVDPAGEGPGGRAGAEIIVDAERSRVLLFGGRDADRAYGDVWEVAHLGAHDD